MGLRFLLGLAVAGLNPSVNVLIKKITPSALTGRVFGFTISAGYLGVFGGSVLGGQVAAWWGIRYIFFITCALLLLNAVLMYTTVFRTMSRQDKAISQEGQPGEAVVTRRGDRVEMIE